MLLQDDLNVIKALEQQLKTIDIIDFYKEIIPLVDEAACLSIAEEVKKHQKCEEQIKND